MKIISRTTVVALAMLAAACGPQPLEGVGDRSGEWIGPVVNGVEFLPRTTGLDGG